MGEKATGRIIRSISGFYDVQLPDQVVTCRARGILRKEGSSPLTGDVVNISLEKGKGMVESILPRRNSFVRPAVANVDALVVFAANVNPITEPFLIDRVAAIAGDQGVEVYLCVNKCDLDPGAELVRIYSHAGFPVISTSAETGDGVEQLRQAHRLYRKLRRGQKQHFKSALPGADPAHRGGLRKAGQRKAYHPPCGAVLPGAGHLCGGHTRLFLL